MFKFLLSSVSQSWESSKLHEKYHIQKVKLGEGSFGTVWRAMDRTTSLVIALKVVEKDKMKKRGVQPEDMAREIKMLYAAVGCPYITELRDSFEDSNAHYLALEYCEGGDFGDKLRERRDVLEEYEAAYWMKQILLALEFLHDKSILHRDLKPDNFMLSNHFVHAVLKLSDFGLAIQLPSPYAVLKDKCGTPAFMSPEQHELPRSGGYSFPTDLFAAGTCLWCILHGGDHPFMIGSSLDLPGLLRGQPQFRGNSSFWAGSKWSDAAQRLCDNLTAREHGSRLTVKQALQDQWFGTHAKQIRDKIEAGRSASKGGLATSADGSGAASSGTSRPTVIPTAADKPLFTLEPYSKNANTSSLQGGHGHGAHQQLGPSLSSSSSPVLSNSEVRKLKDHNRELQAKIDEAAQKDADEKARMAEKIRQLEAQVVATGTGPGITATDYNVHAGGGGGQVAAHGAVPPVVDPPNSNGGNNSSGASEQFGLGNFFNRIFQQPPSLLQPNPSPQRGVVQQLGGEHISKLRNENHIQILRPGQQVCYNSASHGAWFMGTVKRHNPDDGTYDLDLKQRADWDRISPPFEPNASIAWGKNLLVHYWSDSSQAYLDAVIDRYNEDDGTYDLDVRQRATVDKIRIRNVKLSDLEEERTTTTMFQPGAAVAGGIPGAPLPPAGQDQSLFQQLGGVGPAPQQQGSVLSVGTATASSNRRDTSTTTSGARPSGGHLQDVVGQQGGEVVGRLVNPFGMDQQLQNQNQNLLGGGQHNNQNFSSSSTNASQRPSTTAGFAAGGSPLHPEDSPPPSRGAVVQMNRHSAAPVTDVLQQLPGNNAPATTVMQTAPQQDVEAQKFYALSAILKPGMACSYRETDYEPWRSAVVEALAPDEQFLLRVVVDSSSGASGSTSSNTIKAPAMQVSPVGTTGTGGATATPTGILSKWPLGTWVYYHSSSMRTWIATSVQSYSEDGATINLANKPGADPERIRARIKPEPAEKQAIEQTQAQHVEMKCVTCGRVYWSLSGKTKQCPPCRNTG
ncbi:unnamed protein product [Amoebophrya sp. A120]|nr:unnamed protein product [Amoebophrya sp. A120]|eukprot:GSA120T00023729001.1